MKLLVGIALMACSVAAAQADENLLKNLGFEYEGDWNAYESASLRNAWRSHGEGVTH